MIVWMDWLLRTKVTTENFNSTIADDLPIFYECERATYNEGNGPRWHSCLIVYHSPSGKRQEGSGQSTFQI